MNTFQQPDPTGSEFFNDLLDSNIQQQPQYEDDEQAVAAEDELPNEFIQGLESYAAETQDSNLQEQIDALREQLALQQQGVTMDLEHDSLQEQMALYEFYQTPEGEEALMSKYEPNAQPTESSAPSPKYTPIADSIADKESEGDYKALPWITKNGKKQLASSATGKYQFLWGKHSEWITKLTGVKSKEDFLNSPQAQEKAFAYWDKTTLTPTANAIQMALAQANKPVPSIEEIKHKVHFAGAQGAKDYYMFGKQTQDAFGTKTSTYAMGGYVNAFEGGRLVTTTKKRKYAC